MPRSALDDDELAQLISSIIEERGQPKLAELMDGCHEFKPFGGLMPYEIYFHKKLSYRDFNLHFRFLECDGDTVVAADIQFMRSSKGPYVLFNRNRPLVNHLLELLRQRYSGGEVTDLEAGRRIPVVTALLKLFHKRHSGIEVKDGAKTEGTNEGRGRQIHFNVGSAPSLWSASTPFEKWDSECAVYDEPCSSGQTNPSHTPIRNDFVILRFRRRN
jgi:hypothetical protein